MKGGTALFLAQMARRHGGVIRLGAQSTAIEHELNATGQSVAPQSLVNLLGEMVAEGEAISIVAGVYALPDDHGRYNSTAIGPRLAVGPAYASMWPVASMANLSTNVPRLVSVVSTQDGHQVRERILPVPALDVVFYFHTLSPARFFGFTEHPLGDGLTAPVASTEKALVDMLWFGDAPDAPPASEQMAMWEASASSSSVNPKLLLRYVIRMDSPSLTRRAGYLMERFGIKGFESLLEHRGTSKRVIPLFAGDPGVTSAPANRWGVR